MKQSAKGGRHADLRNRLQNRRRRFSHEYEPIGFNANIERANERQLAKYEKQKLNNGGRGDRAGAGNMSRAGPAPRASRATAW